MNNKIVFLILLILLAGCVTEETEETTTTETTTTSTTTTLTSTTITTETTTPEPKPGCDEGCGCLTQEEAGNQSLCGKKLLCGFTEQKKPRYCYQTTTSTTSTTLSKKIDSCRDYCLRNRYADGVCRLNGFDCHRIGGKNEEYKPLGDRYCPRGQADDACCCIIKKG